MQRLVFKNPPPWEDRIKKDGFKFVDAVNKPSIATFTIDNYDYKYSNLKSYQKNFVFCFGEWGQMSPWFKTDIVNVEGSHELKIETHTMETRLMTKPRTRFYEDTTLRGILDVIAGEYGMVGRYDPDVEGLPVPSLNQINETDAQFLRRLAEMTCFNFWIDGDALRFTSEAQSEMITIPYGELLEEPDFKFNFRKLRKKPKIKATQVNAETDERDFDLEDFTQEFGGHEGPKGIGKYSPSTEKSDSTTQHEITLDENLNEIVKEVEGKKEAGGPKHDADEIVARSKAEAVKLAAKKIMKMTMKLPSNTKIWAGKSINLVRAPEGIEGQWFVRQHEYKWPVSTYELSKRGLKSKIEKGQLAACKEHISLINAQVAALVAKTRDPNASDISWESAWNEDQKPKQTRQLNEDLTWDVLGDL